MDFEFIYWAHKTPVGVKVEEVSWTPPVNSNTAKAMAYQIYCEHGLDTYREIGHYANGAPFLYGYPGRISISHAAGLLVVAMLPKTPDIELDTFNPRTAMGIDTERADRQQVIKIRDRFLSSEELGFIAEDNLDKNITAWTCKEALYKASMTDGLDFRENIIIKTLPDVWEFSSKENPVVGEGNVIMSDGIIQEFDLFSYRSDECIVSLALSKKSAKFESVLRKNS